MHPDGERKLYFYDRRKENENVGGGMETKRERKADGQIRQGNAGDFNYEQCLIGGSKKSWFKQDNRVARHWNKL